MLFMKTWRLVILKPTFCLDWAYSHSRTFSLSKPSKVILIMVQRTKVLDTEGTTPRFLYSMIRQLDLKLVSIPLHKIKSESNQNPLC